MFLNQHVNPSTSTSPAKPRTRTRTQLPSSHASMSALRLGASILKITLPSWTPLPQSHSHLLTLSISPMRTPTQRASEVLRNFYFDVDSFSPTSQPSMNHKGRQPRTPCSSPISWSRESLQVHSTCLAIPQLMIILAKVSVYMLLPLDFRRPLPMISSVTNPSHPHLHRH